MRLLQLSAIVLPALLLASCGNTAPPAAPSSETSAPQQVAEAAPAADDSLAPLFGTWALDPAQCGGQVLKISKVRFEGAENGCDVSGYTDNGDGTFTAAMSCTSQGTTADESIKMRPVFAPSGEGIELTYLNRDNLASTVLRCPEPAPAN
jgi:hypothetical protein